VPGRGLFVIRPTGHVTVRSEGYEEGKVVLAMCADRITVGEVRRAETFDMYPDKRGPDRHGCGTGLLEGHESQKVALATCSGSWCR
jgi:hypothetical protein